MSQQQALTAEQQKLSDLWDEHLRTEFSAHAPDEAITTMVANPLVDQVLVLEDSRQTNTDHDEVPRLSAESEHPLLMAALSAALFGIVYGGIVAIVYGGPHLWSHF